MGIRFLCPSCRNKVHVKDRLAGLRGFCPTCGAKVDIPLQSTLPGKSGSRGKTRDDAPAAALDSAANRELSVSAILPRLGRLIGVHANPPSDPLADAAGSVWYIVPPEGTEPFGPADSATVRLWLQQGRIVSRSLVWRQDWPEWRKAGTVWSHLALTDVDPRIQRNTDRVRGKSASSAVAPPAPMQAKVADPLPPASSPGANVGRGTLMAQMQAAVPAAVAANPQASAAASFPSAQYPGGGLTAVPASSPPASAAVPGSGPSAEGLYYPPRSHKRYVAIVVLLLVGLVGMSVALFYVLDRADRQKQHPAKPPEDAAATDANVSDDSKTDGESRPAATP